MVCDVCLATAILGCVLNVIESALVLGFPGGETKHSANQPAVTVLKPLHGVEPELPDRLAAFCRQDYAGAVQLLCGTQDPADVANWSEIQYRFGPETGPPELVFPEDPSTGPPPLFFSHADTKGDYRVTVRFTNGAYTYRVYSGTKTGAGVEVDDASGKMRSDIACTERPEMFIEYMRLNLPCDLKNPHGAAACQENPYGAK